MLIEDRRPAFAGLTPTKSVQAMELGVIDVASCCTGEWCVSAKELVSKLQQSFAAIQGEYIRVTPLYTQKFTWALYP